MITPVKDQGQCGSCWAFSSVAAIEAAYALKTKSSGNTFSEQQIVSCDKANGNSGCNGGNPNTAMAWVSTTGGLAAEADYPYSSSGGATGTCKSSIKKNPNTKTAQVIRVANNFAAMKAALDIGPVTVTVAASSNVWQSYVKGVINSKACAPNGASDIDHAIIAVGYGTDSATGLPYIKCKNSWGNNPTICK